MKIKAYAKINIGLDVIRRREDGYHEVRMIMQNIGVHDELTVRRTDVPGIRIHTDRAQVPVNGDNLIHKAADLMMREFGLDGGIDFDLEKNIPVAAGLAGGSTDAAAALVAVNELFGLGCTKEELMKLGVRIGADVPYCIMGGTALAEGIGEILTPLPPHPGCTVLIARPPVSVSTAHVYGSLRLDGISHPDIDGIITGLENGDIEKIAGSMGNVLETVTVPENPVIDDIKNIMIKNGSLSALMSGSGPTVFGLFESGDRADTAYSELERTGYVSEMFITGIINPDRIG